VRRVHRTSREPAERPATDSENRVTTRDRWTSLLDTDVHIWRIRLDVRDAAFDRLHSVMSEQERERAQRFRFERLQQQYTIAHGALRLILGRYLSIAPDRLRFVEGAHGKPALAEPPATIRFNVSHSEALAVIAFADGRDLGVDIEAIRPVPEMDEIAQRYFSDQEANDLMQTAPDAREQNFFRIWTRKEAFIKAIGDGLSFPLDSFSVSFHPDEEPRLLSVRGDVDAARAWQLHAFDPAPGFTGALAYRGSRVHPRLFAPLDSDELVRAVGAEPGILKNQESI
jgi:4'-phosphopantetheinyl transferase